MKLEQKLANKFRGTDKHGNTVECFTPLFGHSIVTCDKRRWLFKSGTPEQKALAACSFAAELCEYDFAHQAKMDSIIWKWLPRPS